MARMTLTNRSALRFLIVLAPLAWAGLAIYAYFVPPHGLLSFVAFFLLLDVALTSTFAPIAYAIGLRFISSRLYRATVRHALRQGALLALVIVLNLILRALHSWSIITAIIILAAAIVIEVVSLARK
jgi:hypothetical protein